MRPQIHHIVIDPIQLTLQEACEVNQLSESEFRRTLKQFPDVCRPIRYGYRTVRYPLGAVLALQRARRRAVMDRTRAACAARAKQPQPVAAP